MPGNPGRLWKYNWTLDKWSTADVGVKMVFPGFSANVSLEELDALYPGGLETIPYSLDAPLFAGGEPLFFVCYTSNRSEERRVGKEWVRTIKSRWSLYH